MGICGDCLGLPIKLGLVVAVCAASISGAGFCAERCSISKSKYNGWDTIKMSNGIISVQIAPQLGGRLISYSYEGHEFFYASRDLAGKVLPWTDNYAPESPWVNYGGEKVWPAPEGWDGPNQWPGPGNTELETGRWASKVVIDSATKSVLRIVSPKDAYTGLQYTRDIAIKKESPSVDVTTTMKNVSSKPVEWSVWTVTQVETGAKGKAYNDDLVVYCPLNSRSRFEGGYQVLYGPKDNPTWRVDERRAMFAAKYCYRLGKVGLDSQAGWVGVQDNASGYSLVQEFKCFSDGSYPDGGCTVECYSNGAGSMVLAGKEVTMPNDPLKVPCYLEVEILSPTAKLAPGESYTFRTNWKACRGSVEALVGGHGRK